MATDRQRFQNGQHRLPRPRAAVSYKPANTRSKAVVLPHGSEYAAIYSRIAKLIHEATGSSCFAATGGVARGADLFEQRVLGLNAGSTPSALVDHPQLRAEVVWNQLLHNDNRDLGSHNLTYRRTRPRGAPAATCAIIG
jgi:hypothetical protein